MQAMALPRSWDVFCRVVDNYGDAAVCWRLARALARSGAVRLWIDEPDVLHRLVPAVRPDVGQQNVDGVDVCRWVDEPFFGQPADVAVDAFGGGLPEVYAHAMERSLWIVLEYLSAESWVATHHGLPSPHPHLPVQRYFFFPGFGPGTGGLLREPDLTLRRAAMLANRGRFWKEVGCEPPAPEAKVISLFAYENDAVGVLLESCAEGPMPFVAAVPEGRVSADVRRFMGSSRRRGALEVRHLPFLSQDTYDELLWLADWNFVRGEDSFVRAQWAEGPFGWHLYPQEEGAHVAKLEAFVALYSEGLDPPLAEALRTLQLVWNGAAPAGQLAATWRTLWSREEALRAHAARWAVRAAAPGDLAMNLARFCAERLE
jgi:uncharacterized repeat protein (TIGR03837 family)